MPPMHLPTSLAAITGWGSVTLLVTAALVPLLHRARLHKRAVPGSGTLRAHATLGLATSACALVHGLSALGSLGSSEAVGAGMTAFAPGAAAFFLLFAHVGVGLQLLQVKLRDRVKKRHTHLALAISIASLAGLHVTALLLAR
ncbi:Hypothetical protein A7982_00627 [Minicystis rosea]|nr:Hypothetical protein A7982_00627 [Minicystis rosea]